MAQHTTNFSSEQLQRDTVLKMLPQLGIKADIAIPLPHEWPSKPNAADLWRFEADLEADYPHLFGSGGVGSLPLSDEVGLLYIEQVATSCKKYVPYLLGKQVEAKVAVIFKPRCKMWDCDQCRKVNRSLWAMRTFHAVQQIVAEHETVRMVTITANEKHDIKRSLFVYPDQWDGLRRLWQRAVAPKKPRYSMHPEIGAEGHFHVHFLTDCAMDDRWWKDNARHEGMGYIADAGDEDVAPALGAWYCTKYVTKSFDHEWMKGFRRVRTTQTWPKMPPLPKSNDWKFEKLAADVALSDIIETLTSEGFRIAMADNRSAWTVVNAV